ATPYATSTSSLTPAAATTTPSLAVVVVVVVDEVEEEEEEEEAAEDEATPATSADVRRMSASRTASMAASTCSTVAKLRNVEEWRSRPDASVASTHSSSAHRCTNCAAP